MAELEARNEQGGYGWRKPLPPEPFILGRHPDDRNWATEWDNFVSRKHATLHYREGKLHVQKVPTAGNPIFFNNVPIEEFSLHHGESFRIGNTVFTLHDEDAPIEISVAAKEVRNVRFENADKRIEALAALPEIIRQSPDDARLEHQVVQALLDGILHADGAAVVRLLPETTEQEIKVAVSASGRRGQPDGEVRPSRRLVFEAVRRRTITIHVWQTEGSKLLADSRFSLSDPGSDWAMCVPLLDDSSTGYGLYVLGRLPRDLKTADSIQRDNELKSDLRFAQLTADIFGALRQVHDLQRRHSLLLRFLSPRVARVLMTEPNKTVEELLEAKPTEVTVLFCDLRGSCRIAEEAACDLPRLWESVSEALQIMTDAIIANDGVIGDFQGDAAMGFWGWPLPTDDQIELAARAALQIRKHFVMSSTKKTSNLADFACGLGVAHGPAIAGRLGTVDQFKVGVFGPTVNLASRLESMTKQFEVPILVDEAVAAHVTKHRASGWARVRRVAKVKPAGMMNSVLIHELLPPVGPDSLPEQKRLDYESAFDAFMIKRWNDTHNKIKYLTHDGPSRFLQEFMNKYPGGAPADWDGVIPLERK
jgi:adenylate cyclase